MELKIKERQSGRLGAVGSAPYQPGGLPLVL